MASETSSDRTQSVRIFSHNRDSKSPEHCESKALLATTELAKKEDCVSEHRLQSIQEDGR